MSESTYSGAAELAGEKRSERERVGSQWAERCAKSYTAACYSEAVERRKVLEADRRRRFELRVEQARAMCTLARENPQEMAAAYPLREVEGGRALYQIPVIVSGAPMMMHLDGVYYWFDDNAAFRAGGCRFAVAGAAAVGSR